ncbi:tight adherence pilus pseudopilin TadF [Pseudoalteromonas denitrificans]|uniref:Putative tight adherence pilin protein F n=1 Tax=Pseudoalteromonas denitrificans DSM 6059 TaxID=1123010 RepID=A0A1I1LZ97_9GAMM|nr:tight adherence pilus pseudopilin TadF [Pseudoalteromonas denitrificans]SFC74790.1 Putative tight adherence pilin protein F [Pseudoalteromonas denitrificans DSM 6059]
MKLNLNHQRPIILQQGVIALEFAFVLPILILVILLSFDLSRYFQQQGQLDRLSYSLATIISHRQQYYLDIKSNQPKPLNQQQVTELALIARSQLKDSGIAINVHSLIRNVEPLKTAQFSDGSASCQWRVTADINQALPLVLSYQLENEPGIYVVELCQPLGRFSLFALFSGASSFSSLYSRSLTVQR